MSRLFSIIGDSNIRRNMTGLNIASRDSMKTAQVISCPPLSELESALASVRSESNVCIYAGLTGHLLASPEGNTIYATIDPVLSQIRDLLFKICSVRPSLQVRPFYLFIFLSVSDFEEISTNVLPVTR